MTRQFDEGLAQRVSEPYPQNRRSLLNMWHFPFKSPKFHFSDPMGSDFSPHSTKFGPKWAVRFGRQTASIYLLS